MITLTLMRPSRATPSAPHGKGKLDTAGDATPPHFPGADWGQSRTKVSRYCIARIPCPQCRLGPRLPSLGTSLLRTLPEGKGGSDVTAAVYTRVSKSPRSSGARPFSNSETGYQEAVFNFRIIRDRR